MMSDVGFMRALQEYKKEPQMSFSEKALSLFSTRGSFESCEDLTEK